MFKPREKKALRNQAILVKKLMKTVAQLGEDFKKKSQEYPGVLIKKIMTRRNGYGQKDLKLAEGWEYCKKIVNNFWEDFDRKVYYFDEYLADKLSGLVYEDVIRKRDLFDEVKIPNKIFP